MQPYLIKAENLSKSFTTNSFFNNNRKIKVIDNISFSIKENESFGLLGKTGSGKSTIGLCLLKLIESDSGNVFFRDFNIMKARPHELRKARKKMQIVFQEPDTSLNPVYTIGETLGEVLAFHKMCDREETNDYIYGLLEQVGLSPKEKNKYPHEFSTGQKQRICIARALAVKPEFIVLDEVTSALDVMNQNKIIELLQDLQERYKMSYLFISHNLELVKIFCQYAAFLKEGKILMEGKNEDILDEMQKHYF